MTRIVRELTEAVVLAFIVLLLIQGSIRNFRVDGSSMLPTLEGGQFLLVNKLVYFKIDTGRISRIIPFWDVDEPRGHFAIHPPKRGEVIVFRFPEDPSKDFVKRVIGLPGEAVELRNGTVYVDGVALEEPYLTERDNANEGPTLVQEKEYYVLGDNRRSSRDSRAWGGVPEENLLGKVWVVYWPFSQIQLLNPMSAMVQHLFK
jgi:signal peptidase I